MRNTKKALQKLTSALICAAMLPVWGFAANAADSYDFTLRANGSENAAVALGAEVEITLAIESDADYTLYSMQDYVKFDTEYFELDEDSITVKQQLISDELYTDIFSAVPIDVYGEGYDRIFVNRAALTGIDFSAEETILTFSLTAVKEGVTEITHYRTEMLDGDGKQLTVNENSAAVTIGDVSDKLIVTSSPSASKITRGSMLSKSTLSGGTVTNAAGTEISGTWEWADGTETMSKTGTYERTAVFTADDASYETVEATVTVTVYTSGGSSGGSSGGGSSTASTYGVSSESADEGAVSADVKAAKAGDTVTFTITPAAGYSAGNVTVTDSLGNTIAVTQNEDGTYSFVMPSSEVSIDVEYIEADGTSSGDTSGGKSDDSTSGAHVCPSEKFGDVDTSLWYHEYIDYALENGLMTGTSDEDFEPNTETTRGMIVTILYRLEGEPTAAAASDFTDVTAGAWYADAVAWAAENGIVKGYDNGKFGANDTITREQTAAILYRYAGYKGYDTSASGDITAYSDSTDVSAYALTAMQWAVGTGLITGKDNNTLAPQSGATRAETAAMLMRFIEAE